MGSLREGLFNVVIQLGFGRRLIHQQGLADMLNGGGANGFANVLSISSRSARSSFATCDFNQLVRLDGAGNSFSTGRLGRHRRSYHRF